MRYFFKNVITPVWYVAELLAVQYAVELLTAQYTAELLAAQYVAELLLCGMWLSVIMVIG